MNIKYLVRNSNIYQSLKAAYFSLSDFIFNLRLSFIHLYNFHFNKKIKNYERLHFGCGKDYKTDFLNIDLAPPADVFLDARNKLPFEDGSIKYIYSSHFVEHLEHDELMTHFRECKRMLCQDGILRMAIPDFQKAMIAYLNKDMERLEIVKQRFPLNMNSIKGINENLVCYMDYLNRGIHEYGQHKILLDLEKVKNMLIACGFQPENVSLSTFDSTIDVQIRDFASFYIIAIKASL